MRDNLIKNLKEGFLPPEIIIPWFGFVIKNMGSLKMKSLFNKIGQKDATEIFILIALEIGKKAKTEKKTKKEMARMTNALFRKNLKNYGFQTKKDHWGDNASWYKDTKDWEIAIEEIEKLGFDPGSPWKCSISAKEQVKCGIPGCKKNGIYLDEKYGKICHNHEGYIALRTKKGWNNPYRGIEDGFRPNYKKKGPFKNNRAFWKFIQSQITEEKWGQIWRWAKGREKEIDIKIFEEIRETIIESISNLPEHLQKFKKEKSLVFINLTCKKCGNKFEFDLLQKIKNDVKIPTLCPSCGGRNHSKRTYRTAHILKKIKKGEVTRDNAALLLGYHPQNVGKFRKILETKGIEALGSKLGDPFFKKKEKKQSI
ncbi:hypothetical protein K8R62_03405 [bacterium]|nr:hypothetical protein [bacterium]